MDPETGETVVSADLPGPGWVSVPRGTPTPNRTPVRYVDPDTGEIVTSTGTPDPGWIPVIGEPPAPGDTLTEYWNPETEDLVASPRDPGPGWIPVVGIPPGPGDTLTRYWNPETEELVASPGSPGPGWIPIPAGEPVPDGGNVPGGGDFPGGGPDGTTVSSDTPTPAGTPASGQVPAAGSEPVTVTVTGYAPEEAESPEEAADGEADNGPLIDIQDLLTPLSGWADRFQPAGSTYNGRTWALMNLAALLYIFYLLFPLTYIKAKYFRSGTMKKVNRAKENLFHTDAEDLNRRELLEKTMIAREAVEEKAIADGADVEAALREAEETSFAEVTEDEFTDAADKLYYQVREFVRRFRAGLCLESATAIVAAVVFALTEDIRLPMGLIDKWTPLMLVFLALCWVLDLRFARYRGDRLWEDPNRRGEAEKTISP